jgi:drug/metabolite transporter (DMT)-like permease
MKKTYLLYAGISIFFWSTLATVSKLLLGSMNSYQLLCGGSLFAAVALLIVNIANGKIKLLKSYRLKDYGATLFACLPGTFLYYVFFYLGTERIPASQAFIINYLWPIMSVLFASFILKERLTARKCIAFALSFLGVLTVAGGDLLSFNSSTLTGVLFCVLAAVSYGAFTALNQKQEYDDQVSMMIAFFASFIMSAVISVIIGDSFPFGIWEIVGVAWNGIFILALATVTWAAALKKGGTARVSSLAYITPFLSLVWTFVILHDPIDPLSLIGLAIIIIGIFIQRKDSK